MTIITRLSAAIAITTLFCSLNLFAQEGTGGLVTVLDVAKVFEQNQAFSTKMEQIKTQATALKESIQERQRKIQQDAMAVQDLEVGSETRNQRELELEQRQTALRTEARQKEQDLLNREAQIYYETYEAMQSVVTKVAQENNIALVLRYDSTPIDKTNRNEVIKGVNRTVVYHKQLDLTKLVSETLNARTAGAGRDVR